MNETISHCGTGPVSVAALVALQASVPWTLQAMWDRVLPTAAPLVAWDICNWKPDVVVINLGAHQDGLCVHSGICRARHHCINALETSTIRAGVGCASNIETATSVGSATLSLIIKTEACSYLSAGTNDLRYATKAPPPATFLAIYEGADPNDPCSMASE